MDLNKQVEKYLSEFDTHFGTDGPDGNSDSIGRIAGCDDCYESIMLRSEHREFMKSRMKRIERDGYMRCYDKVESIIAEFGDNPAECLSIIGQMNEPEPVEY